MTTASTTTTTAAPLPLELRPPAWAVIPRLLWPIVVGVIAALLMNGVVAPLAGGYGTLVVFAGINIILGVSLTIVNGFTGQFSIGHAGFMALGAYTAAAVTYYGSYLLYGNADAHGGRFSSPTGPVSLLASGDALFVTACIIGGLVAAAAGWVVGLPSLRLRGDYLAIVTLGFGEIVRVVLQGTDTQLFSKAEFDATPKLQLFNKLGGALGFVFLPTYTSSFWVYLWVAIMLMVAIRLKYSSYGRALLSIREDEIAAQAVGINVTKYKVRAFVLSSFFAGVAGALYAMQIGAVNAGDLGFQRSFEILIIVVLGGLGSISGSLLAAVILTILPELLRSLGPYLPARLGDIDRYRMIIYALVLIVMMIVRPKGLLGVGEIWDVFFRRGKRRCA